MRAVANLFIARSRSAVFWFAVTCVAPLAAGWYVQSVIADVRTLPQFVMTGLPTCHYKTADLEFESMQQMHAIQTRLAMETIFNRSPGGLDHHERRFHLFSDAVNEIINREQVTPQVLFFRDTKSYQKVEIEKIDTNVEEGKGVSSTLAYAQLIRTGMENGMFVNKSFSVKVFFEWETNPNPVERPMYPTICTGVTFYSTIQTFP